MKNFIKKFVLGLLIAVFAVGTLASHVHATTPVKAVIYKIDDTGGSLMDVYIAYIDPTIHQTIETEDFQLHYGASGGAYTDIVNYTVGEIEGLVATEVATHAVAQGYSIAASDIMFESVNTLSPTDLTSLKSLLTSTPSSYQTIVSQTGTSAPAVAGGMTPVNSYSGTTFTWARTGAGVYTITASQAVFNTSGKTGVFIQPLNNLNASVRGTVTSSTVVTITTAVQSVAILGLLGLTTTPTDALLANSMIYIQTYP